jgi:HD superfamily phosphodiesterase
VAVDDPGVALDMDEPPDYGLCCEAARRERLPRPEDRRRLMEQSGLSADAWEHADAVARVAAALGRALQAAGACLDLELLEAAALLHDVARDHPGHAAAGAAVLRGQGYPRIAALVALHMDVIESTPALPGEAELLYLADKLVLGDRLVSLEQRRARSLARFGGDDAARAAAVRRIEAALRIAARIERSTGRSLGELIEGAVATPAVTRPGPDVSGP